MPAYKGTFIFDRYSCWEERRGCHYYQCDMRSKNLFLKRTVGIGKPCSQPQIPTFISPVNASAVPISCHCFFLLHQKHITENNTLQWLLKGPAMNQLFSNGSCNQQATLETFANHIKITMIGNLLACLPQGTRILLKFLGCVLWSARNQDKRRRKLELRISSELKHFLLSAKFSCTDRILKARVSDRSVLNTCHSIQASYLSWKKLPLKKMEGGHYIYMYIYFCRFYG